uniref:Cytochrome c oxidase assembly factor 5 n=1 Tax=Noctiluca scintillans TaxID=2966 RepID=A0A7S1F5Z2_NOCSC|mmetsp:Transcript_36811/g.98005  ORF Transcript_36811/g.98005 Transcript_36811/m.98005 type:complete len:132 (+) Transcript_36811:69-464(+)
MGQVGASGAMRDRALPMRSPHSPVRCEEEPGADKEPGPKKEPWLPPGSFRIDPTKPHRKPSNSCDKIKQDMLQCYENTKCYQSHASFEECLHSDDPEWVNAECIWLRKGYAQCRRDMLNRNRIWQRGNRSS